MLIRFLSDGARQELTGNAATNIVYPFTVLALGLALLIGDGTAAQFSIALVRMIQSRQTKILVTDLSFKSGWLLYYVSGLLCRTQVLALFGGNPEEVECYQYATDYYKIICIGIPFI